MQNGYANNPLSFFTKRSSDFINKLSAPFANASDREYISMEKYNQLSKRIAELEKRSEKWSSEQLSEQIQSPAETDEQMGDVSQEIQKLKEYLAELKTEKQASAKNGKKHSKTINESKKPCITSNNDNSHNDSTISKYGEKQKRKGNDEESKSSDSVNSNIGSQLQADDSKALLKSSNESVPTKPIHWAYLIITILIFYIFLFVVFE